jgi:short-subunit dehydrogenase
MPYVLILGAKSDMAKAIARQYANNGYNLYLAARNVDELQEFASDIYLKTDQVVECIEFDVLDYPSHQAFYDNLAESPEGVVTAIGYLGDQGSSEVDFNETQRVINTNFTGITSILNTIANEFEKRKSGFIVGISSVAGDRGRRSNYIYGAAKAGFTAYLSGLRSRLFSSKVHVLTVKPGFVATRMTEGMDLPAKLTAQPEQVAKDVFNAQQKGKNILYTKWIWLWIMLIIKHIPEWQFKKMSI